MQIKPRTKIMAILNVTPDSFSDGGRFDSVDKALVQANKLVDEGADILDIGGESTRPFAEEVSLAEELERVIPVIEAVREKHPKLPISIDTTKAEVAKRAIASGATMINDISACQDAQMAQVAVQSGVSLVIMHMQGTPANMQVAPHYENAMEEVLQFFRKRIAELVKAGVKREKIIVDPGIGFGKRLEHNLSLIKHLNRFTELDQPILLAHSRKRFLQEITGIKKEQERDHATAVVSALACAPWLDFIRVHNVALTKQALLVAEAIENAN